MVCSTALIQPLTWSFLFNKLFYIVVTWYFKIRQFGLLHQNEKCLVYCTKLYAFLVGILRSNHIPEIMTLLCMLAINVETGKLYKRGKYGLRFFFTYYKIQESLLILPLPQCCRWHCCKIWGIVGFLIWWGCLWLFWGFFFQGSKHSSLKSTVFQSS